MVLQSPDPLRRRYGIAEFGSTEEDPSMHIDPRDEPSGSKSGKNKRKLDFRYMPYRIYVHLHTCASGLNSFGYMYFWIVLYIYVLLDTCIVGDMYFWIYIYFLIHVH